MTAKGYCTADDVAEFLALDFTAAQVAQCDTLIERAEVYFDNETERGFLVGVQTNEAHYVSSQNVFLKYAPVTSIASIVGRDTLGESETTLVEDTDYEVIDLTIGRVRLVYPGSYDRVRVTYTPTDTVPGDVKQALVEMVAAWMSQALTPGTYGLDSYSLPDLTVRFARSHVQSVAPPMAQAVIDRYRYGVHA